ncbi:MAG: hypothetical protein NC218_01960 [Acetobacter sp.]|nr:hypothetical protein [Acetobacter sp.]
MGIGYVAEYAKQLTNEQIVEQLTEWSNAYYEGNQRVTDVEYDYLEDALRQRDPLNSWFTHNREQVNHGTKVRHKYEFIGSIEKIHELGESRVLGNQRNSNTSSQVLNITGKLDGTSMVTYFVDGKLDYSATRGDGVWGIDVTKHFLAIARKYQLHIPKNFTGGIRGEVIFKNKSWEVFKAKHPEAKSPRNSATGLVNQKDVQVDEDLLDWVVYDFVGSSVGEADYWSYLESFGFPMAPSIFCSASAVSEGYLQSLFDTWKQEFPLDGLVLREPLPPRATTDGIYLYSKHQEAFKFQAEIKECKVTDIVWQMGRTGKLTPVLKIEPVEMSGAVVTSITAHNMQNVKEKRLGKGATIRAYRSGEVIPTLLDVLSYASNTVIPTTCPYCGQELEVTPTGKDIVCNNDDCKGKNKFRIYNFLEVICSDIKGLGEVFLENFVNETSEDFGFDPDDVSLNEFLVAAVNHWGQPYKTLGNADNKVAVAILDQLVNKIIPADKFLLSLGIKLLGTEAAKRLASTPAKTEAMLEALLSNDIMQIGHSIREAVQTNALTQNIMSSRDYIAQIYSFFKGKIVFPKQVALRYYAITGSLSKGRKEIQDEFKAKGWEMTDNLNKAECLITNDPNSGSSKNVKAKSLNKDVLTEADFRQKYLGE